MTGINVNTFLEIPRGIVCNYQRHYIYYVMNINMNQFVLIMVSLQAKGYHY